MTLSDMATFVTNKVNLSETNDVAACKTFLQRRFEMIWNEALWKDSIKMFTASVGTYSSPVGSLGSSSAGPSGTNLPSALWLPTSGTFVCPNFVDRVLSVRSDVRHLNVQRQEAYYRIDFDSFAQVGTPSEYVLLSPVIWQYDVATLISITNSSSADNGAMIQVTYLDVDGVSPVSISTALPGALGNPVTLAVTAFTKPVTQGTAGIISTASVADFSLSATQTAAPRRQRVQFLSKPDNTNNTLVTNFRFLVKARPPQFVNDTDEPQLTNIENALISFAHADMLVRARQYGKAATVAQEASSLLDQLKRIETLQQAHEQHLVPEVGYMDDWDMRGHQPLGF